MELLAGIFARYNPRSAASTKNPPGHKTRNINIRNSSDFTYNNIVFYYISDQPLLLSSAASLLDPIPEQSHVTLHLSWKVCNISAGTESGISGSCGAAIRFPLPFSPWHLSLHPTTGNRAGLPWHNLWHNTWNHTWRTSGELGTALFQTLFKKDWTQIVWMISPSCNFFLHAIKLHLS